MRPEKPSMGHFTCSKEVDALDRASRALPSRVMAPSVVWQDIRQGVSSDTYMCMRRLSGGEEEQFGGQEQGGKRESEIGKGRREARAILEPSLKRDVLFVH